jgi:hypothetical protein
MATKYKHMLKEDEKIWERFLEQYGGDFIGFEYDVLVGRGAEIPPDTPEEYRKQIETVSKLRIDVVAEKENEIWIIEVKPESKLSAIGQLPSYEYFFIKERKPEKPIRKVFVCEAYTRDFEELCNYFEIQIIRV